jgi:hypothetical protein
VLNGGRNLLALAICGWETSRVSRADGILNLEKRKNRLTAKEIHGKEEKRE